MSPSPFADHGLFIEIKELIQSAKQRAAVAINVELTTLYWQVGKRIFAFTATPKTKTLELFGRLPKPDEVPSKRNKPEAYHVYSMRQAIEEGFILDVLKNYTNYKVAYNLALKIQASDQEVESKRAKVKLNRWVRLHDYNKIFNTPGSLPSRNEISKADNKSRKNVKNFIKQLVTDFQVQSERKYEDAATERIFGNVLITSNESYVLEIEPSDRRYTVIQTGQDLKKAGWNIPKALKDIRSELHGFADFLRRYDVDWVDYHKALDTPEKQALIASTTDRFSFFVAKLKEGNPNYFETMVYEQGIESSLNPEQIKDETTKAYKDGFTVDLLSRLFKLMNDNEEITSRKLLKSLRAVDPILFENKNAVKDSGGNYKANGTFYFIVK